MRDLVTFAIGGGWGEEEPFSGSQCVAVIRGADFPAVAAGDAESLPLRHEPAAKVAKRRLLPGDIVLEISGGTRDRPTGRTVLISNEYLTLIDAPAIPASFCRLVRFDKGRVDARFMYYHLQQMHSAGRTWAYQNRSTGIANFQFEYFLDSEVVALPPLEEQQDIAAIVGALDDKMKSNRRLVVLTEKLMAAELVQATLSDSVRQVPVTGLARFVNGGAYTKGATGSGRMVLRIAELNSGPGGSTVYTELDVPDDKTARAGDLLMSWSGSLDIYRWTRDEAIINQHIFKVIPNEIPAWLVHDRLKAVMPIFQSIAKDKATTMGHIQRGHLESTMVPMPSPAQVARLDARLGPLWERLLLSEREIHTLAALRDALLPELLSGRLRVPEAGEAIDQALA